MLLHITWRKICIPFISQWPFETTEKLPSSFSSECSQCILHNFHATKMRCSGQLIIVGSVKDRETLKEANFRYLKWIFLFLFHCLVISVLLNSFIVVVWLFINLTSYFISMITLISKLNKYFKAHRKFCFISINKGFTNS